MDNNGKCKVRRVVGSGEIVQTHTMREKKHMEKTLFLKHAHEEIFGMPESKKYS